VGETSNYECASEIRAAISALREELVAALVDLVRPGATELTLRQRAALQCLASLLQAEGLKSSMLLWQPDARERVAEIAWACADALVATEGRDVSGHLGEHWRERHQREQPPAKE